MRVALARVARGLSEAELGKLMDISPNLARLNADRFRTFEEAQDDVRPAALAFAGDTYQGLEAASLDADDMRFCAGAVAYPCRGSTVSCARWMRSSHTGWEMGSRLKTEKGPNLYAYWGDRLARALNEEAARLGTATLINCASVEYFSAVDADALKLEVITPQFLEDKPGGPKIVSFYAKEGARGDGPLQSSSGG